MFVVIGKVSSGDVVVAVAASPEGAANALERSSISDLCSVEVSSPASVAAGAEVFALLAKENRDRRFQGLSLKPDKPVGGLAQKFIVEP